MLEKVESGNQREPKGGANGCKEEMRGKGRGEEMGGDRRTLACITLLLVLPPNVLLELQDYHHAHGVSH
jgi:hypothetical protein